MTMAEFCKKYYHLMMLISMAWEVAAITWIAWWTHPFWK
jgi:hypothetical protein